MQSSAPAYIPARATIHRVSFARKSVIVRKLTRDWCAGYTTGGFSSEIPDLELLDTTGKLVGISWNLIKWVCFVRELNAVNGSDGENPERLLRRRFTTRPRAAGLWLRITFGDGEELEGLAANDRSLIEGVGVLLTPPDTRSNTQRVFVPRCAIRDFTVLGVVAPKSPATGSGQIHEDRQPELFALQASEEAEA